tara:strand:- start:1330 stop:1812 length:483 start_codon:yes stop_codon:yes gene_type:complete
MKLISHRGNIVGPNPTRENTPSYIDTSISAGYDVEVDVNYDHINEKFYLGHDTPDYEITEKWMSKRREKIWFHCKNLEAASRLGMIGDYKFFCHTTDGYVLTSTGHVWVHDLEMNLDTQCIIPLLSDMDIKKYNGDIPYAVCTDYISLAEYDLKQKGIYK